jgi:hypothetical protein
MNLQAALSKARQILDEERAFPTVTYRIDPSNEPAAMAALLATLGGEAPLYKLRKESPRRVLEDRSLYKFESVNYAMLRSLLYQIHEQDRPSFARYLSDQIVNTTGSFQNPRAAYPCWLSFTSEFPLIAEFLVRNRGKGELIKALKLVPSIEPGQLILLIHLDEVICLNYGLFTETEYKDIADAVDGASKRTRRTINVTGRSLYEDVQHYCKAVKESCRKAAYLYLKSSLLEGLNQEINEDRTAVEHYLKQYGLSQPLLDSLNEADKLYRQEASPFDLKSCMGHLRSFLENAQAEAIAKCIGGPSSLNWGSGLEYLMKNGALSSFEKNFASSIYGLISDSAFHPLFAEREYARLARNIVIEYTLLLFRKLEKYGGATRK